MHVFLGLPLFDEIRVHYYEAHQVFSLGVAVHPTLLHILGLNVDVFQVLRVYEIARLQLEDGRDPVNDLDRAIGVNLCDVTAPDPPVLDVLLGRLPIVEVARHHGRSLEAHFTSWWN